MIMFLLFIGENLKDGLRRSGQELVLIVLWRIDTSYSVFKKMCAQRGHIHVVACAASPREDIYM